MEIIRLIADLFGTGGMLFFLVAEIHQLLKIRRTGKLTGISFHAYRDKMLAVIFTLICFGLSNLYFSFIVLFLEGIIITPILFKLWKKKKYKILSTDKFLMEIKKW